jgi:hypothetical protein
MRAKEFLLEAEAKKSWDYDLRNNPWHVTDVDAVSETDFEVALQGPENKQLNYIIRPIDFIEQQPQRFQIDSMDVRDLQTGKTFHVPMPGKDEGWWIQIWDAIDTYFWMSPPLQKQLKKIIDYYMEQGASAGEFAKNPDLMPGLANRPFHGIGGDNAISGKELDDFISSHEKTQDVLTKMKKGPGQQAITEEERLLDPDLYGEMLPTATVGRIVRAVVAEVDPSAVVKIKGSPEGYYLVSTDTDMLTFDFGITADGGEISANIVNAYNSYKGGIVTKIIDLCFKAMVKKYGRPEKFVISTLQDRGYGVWQHIAQKLGAEWGGSVMENFADGKVKGKSRPGRVKRSGASCNGSVADLRRKAKNASGERARMFHWCANMKSGRKK